MRTSEVFLIPMSFHISLSLLFLIFHIICAPVFAQQERFPFVAEAITDRVHVRAGQSENFESLYRLDRGTKIVVLDKQYSWYKVKLSVAAKSFISSKYVQSGDGQLGTISGTRVNVRAGKGINHSILGQLTKGDRVTILEEFDGWVRIAPIRESYGWVKENFIVFKSKDVALYKPIVLKVKKPVVPVKVEIAPAVEPQEIFLDVKEIVEVKDEKVQKVEEKQEYFVAVMGYLKKTGAKKYTLLINNRLKYYVDGNAEILDQFLDYQVTVEGSVQDKAQLSDVPKTMFISKIELVL
ncbi:hypothetical protein MNBD_UNCLBAC01-1508 [hydrothermal vent metagenome]|uniref:SH3b domain-containing protein n=1 Tax=hydrothermal vent metagenome TaxID=652676 RepID=A0A3B1D4L1_9ZZZZ